MPFLSQKNVDFYGSLQEKNEDLEAINYSLLQQVKPLTEENKGLYRDNVALSLMNEQLKLDKLVYSVIIDKIGKEFEIPKEALIGIINGVEEEYNKPKMNLTEHKILKEVGNKNKQDKEREALKNATYKGKQMERTLGYKK